MSPLNQQALSTHITVAVLLGLLVGSCVGPHRTAGCENADKTGPCAQTVVADRAGLGAEGPAPGPAMAGADYADTTRAAHLATFGAPTAVSWSNLGEIFVADAQAQSIVVIDSLGSVTGSLGGTGFGGGSFQHPADVDASGGLLTAVADAGSGRVQLFARDGRFVESILLPGPGDSGTTDSQYLEGQAVMQASGKGVPERVAWSAGAGLYAIDGADGALIIWDRERVRWNRVLLEDEVSDLIVQDQNLVLASRRSGRLMVMDPFGTLRFVQTVHDWDETIALGSDRRGLWLAGPKELALIGLFFDGGTPEDGDHQSARILCRSAIDLPDDLVDAAFGDGMVLFTRGAPIIPNGAPLRGRPVTSSRHAVRANAR